MTAEGRSRACSPSGALPAASGSGIFPSFVPGSACLDEPQPQTDLVCLWASRSLLLPDAAFEARIADGTIHPGLERGPAAEMIDLYFSSLPKRRTR